MCNSVVHTHNTHTRHRGERETDTHFGRNSCCTFRHSRVWGGKAALHTQHTHVHTCLGIQMCDTRGETHQLQSTEQVTEAKGTGLVTS